MNVLIELMDQYIIIFQAVAKDLRNGDANPETNGCRGDFAEMIMQLK
jgi:hypothetical protein